jgi:hypothetical protein
VIGGQCAACVTDCEDTGGLSLSAVCATQERFGDTTREHVQAEWESQPRHSDPIFARDRWRCAVPACSRKQLHDHHIVFRSRGGDNARDNRITVSAWHHLRGIHAGIVRATGDAPADITWELGVRAGRRPLLRRHGDRYLQ